MLQRRLTSLQSPYLLPWLAALLVQGSLQGQQEAPPEQQETPVVELRLLPARPQVVQTPGQSNIQMTVAERRWLLDRLGKSKTESSVKMNPPRPPAEVPDPPSLVKPAAPLADADDGWVPRGTKQVPAPRNNAGGDLAPKTRLAPVRGGHPVPSMEMKLAPSAKATSPSETLESKKSPAKPAAEFPAKPAAKSPKSPAKPASNAASERPLLTSPQPTAEKPQDEQAESSASTITETPGLIDPGPIAPPDNLPAELAGDDDTRSDEPPAQETRQSDQRSSATDPEPVPAEQSAELNPVEESPPRTAQKEPEQDVQRDGEIEAQADD
ncbi:MAG: hypothetical protein MI861_00815, partial [Pirellulales bacterium]|nr:hypothetical protein [Pirellulales bacterium]